MLKRRFDGKTIGALLIMVMTVCLSAFAATRSADQWTLNPSDFRYDMSLYFSCANGKYADPEAYEIGAFIDDECRGIAESIELPEGGSCLYMRIRSNSADAQEVTFLAREKSTGETVVLKGGPGEAFTFKPDTMVGLPSEPYELTAYFEIKIAAGDHGSVEFTDGMYAEGTEISVKAVADEGCHFVKWSDGTETAELTFEAAADVDLTAEFALSAYNLVFRLDGEILEQKEVLFGSPISAPAVEEKTGYTFSGWGELPDTMPAEDLEFSAEFKVNYYKLSFVIDDVVIKEEEVAYGSEIVAPATPDKEGHTFEGWLNMVETMPAEDLVIFGSYKVNSHLLIYMIGDDIIEEHVVAFGSEITPIEAPAKEGYTFDGWKDLPATMPAKDLTVYGSYTVNSYKITFVADGNTVEEITLDFGSEINTPEAPEKEGYTFDGWTDLPATMPAKDLTVTASYKVNYYKLSFVIDDVVVEEKEVAYGSEITAPATPDKEGHSFEGWLNMVETMPAEDLVIFGSYKVNSHLLIYMIGDDIIEEHVVAFGSEITPIEAPAKEGYTFDGWKDLPTTMPAKDLTVYGSYTANIYKVTFVIADEFSEEKEFAFGSEIVAPEAPAKEGYTFGGWKDLPETMPAKDLTVNGSYEVNYYKLTFIVGEDIIEEKEVAYGSEIVPPAAPVIDGMIFDGWDEMPATMPARDVVVKGTMIQDPSLAVDSIGVDADENVTVYSLGGKLLFRNVKAAEVAGRLAPGLYIINGKKTMVK